ncbi:MAG: transcription-repair coupling factor [Acidobacteriota bacterium]
MSTPSELFVDAADRLRRSDAYASLVDRPAPVTRLPTGAAAWVLGLLARDLDRPLVVVVPHESDAIAWLEAATLLLGDEPLYLPAPSLSPYQDAETSLLVRAEEAVALDRLRRATTRTVVTTPRGLFRRLPPPPVLNRLRITVSVGDERPLDGLVADLLRSGYHRSDLVVEVGQMAVRGGVFDVFPPGRPLPVRLDLFGDTVESIREFDPESQRSADSLDSVALRPLVLFPAGGEDAELLAMLLAEMAGEDAAEETTRRIAALRTGEGFDGWHNLLPLLASETVDLVDFTQRALGGVPLVAALDPETLSREVEHHRDSLERDCAARAAQGRPAPPPEALEQPATDVLDRIESAAVPIGALIEDPRHRRAGALDFGASLTDLLHDQLPRFPREVALARSRDEQPVLVVPEGHAGKIREMLGDLEIAVGGSGVELIEGELTRGFRVPGAAITFFGERQLLRRSPIVRRKTQRPRYGPFLSSMRDLKVGDYVVHVDHGIGQFVGLRTLGAEGPSQDLPSELAAAAPRAADAAEIMELVYAGGKRLLLPLARIDQVQKYSGIEGVAPRLDKLGGTSWNRTKSRIKKGMRDMAAELLKLYAERQLATAPAMSADSDQVRAFEAAFEHEETPDQLTAIEDIKKDLEDQRPMDRLLCGDVGFGKTEVAMRAAMKAVDSGFQVAVLAPTTILADQHLETFQRRFDGFPINIDMVSRFRSPAEVREIQKKTAAGGLDILIGTHRLLSRNIQFKKLGLLIVDEEQRFGVAQKEKLKTLKKDVHVLAMSATPVPRTLQLSLAGVRDLALIETPPRDRMAVETAIVPYDSQLIREAVEFELERGGQVYYVYNRVETIEQMAQALKEIVPGLRLTIGHGQLEEGELAKRMHAFTDRKYDLLLATTIIENGIDIPNVNTMIVHRADRFGLAQLYQLRGRVGRSDQLAYCYLLVPSDRILTQQAHKRLEAIREFTELGAGFRVAGRDLEIRGAGNLLGAEQSGHIAALGIETYLKMLEETVAELRGEAPEEAPSVTLDLPVPMSIPEEYVGDANLRLELYRRIAVAEEEEAKVLDELRDRFGEPPPQVRTFLRAAGLKRRAEELRLQSIVSRGGRLVMHLRQDARIDPERLIGLVSERAGTRFSPSGALTLEGVGAEQVLDTAIATLEHLAS